MSKALGEAHRISMSTKIAVALVLSLAAIIALVIGDKYNSTAKTVTLPYFAKPASETPIRATKSDRLDVPTVQARLSE